MSEPTCQLCTRAPLSTPAEHAMLACQACADKIGIIPMPPARRPPRPCPQCNGFAFLRVVPREHSAVPRLSHARMLESAADHDAQVSAPMYVTYLPTAHHGWVFHHARPIEIEHHGRGLLETYICRGCGAVEWYCFDVTSIPVHPHLMTELIDYGSESPYR